MILDVVGFTAADIIAIIAALGSAISAIIVAWKTGRQVTTMHDDVRDVQNKISTSNGATIASVVERIDDSTKK